MTRTVLVTGSALLLGTHLTARLLATTGDLVLFAPWGPEPAGSGDLTSAVRRVLRRLGGTTGDAPVRGHPTDRLRCLRLGPALTELAADPPVIDQVWCLTGTPWAGGPEVVAADAAGTRALLAMLDRLGVTEVNYVGSGYAAGLDPTPVAEQPWSDPSAGALAARCPAAGYRLLEREVSGFCAERRIGHRVVRTGLVAGDDLNLAGILREGALPLFGALYQVVREIRERLGEYFSCEPLRVHAAEDGRLSLVEVGAVAAALVDTRDGAAGQVRHVTAPEPVRVRDLLAQLAEAYEIPLVTVSDPDELTAVDRQFADRLGSFTELFRARTAFTGSAGPGQRGPDGTVDSVLFRQIRRGQELGVRLPARVRARVAVRRHTIEAHGSVLTYQVAGSTGPTVVIVNALCQGLGYWQRLVERLAGRYRVIMWEPRGTEPGARTVLLPDQVTDLAEVLRHEGVTSCDLLGWCTGAKVAVEFYLRRPSVVRSMVLLNGSFRAGSRFGEPDTPYERQLDAFCRVIGGHPSVAGSMIGKFAHWLAEEFDPTEEADPHRLAERVLGLTNRNLTDELRRPFQDGPTAVNYARQLLDYWAHDTLASADKVRVPMLFVGAELDRITSPEQFRRAAACFPTARYVPVGGATHFVMYDRPDLIAGLVDGFLGGRQAPDAEPGRGWQRLSVAS